MKERKVISVFQETYQMLLKKKLKRASSLQKEITWDEFFQELVKGFE